MFVLVMSMAGLTAVAMEATEGAADYPSEPQQTGTGSTGTPGIDGGLSVAPPDIDLCCDSCDTNGPHITCTNCTTAPEDIFPPSMQHVNRCGDRVLLECPDDRPHVWDGDKFTCGS